MAGKRKYLMRILDRVNTMVSIFPWTHCIRLLFSISALYTLTFTSDSSSALYMNAAMPSIEEATQLRETIASNQWVLCANFKTISCSCLWYTWYLPRKKHITEQSLAIIRRLESIFSSVIVLFFFLLFCRQEQTKEYKVDLKAGTPYYIALYSLSSQKKTALKLGYGVVCSSANILEHDAIMKSDSVYDIPRMYTKLYFPNPSMIYGLWNTPKSSDLAAVFSWPINDLRSVKYTQVK